MFGNIVEPQSKQDEKSVGSSDQTGLKNCSFIKVIERPSCEFNSIDAKAFDGNYRNIFSLRFIFIRFQK
jgi:hypothetical protein